MDIQKERDLYLAELLEREVITQCELKGLVFKPEINAFDSNYLSSWLIDKINFGWSAWQAAKAQAVPSQPTQFNLNEFLEMEQKLDSKDGVIKADLDRFTAYAEMVLEKAKELKESK